jgi:hypothetical protein
MWTTRDVGVISILAMAEAYCRSSGGVGGYGAARRYPPAGLVGLAGVSPSDPIELTEILDGDKATQTDHGAQFDG